MGASMGVPVGVVISVAVEKDKIEICYSNFESRKRKVEFFIQYSSGSPKYFVKILNPVRKRKP